MRHYSDCAVHSAPALPVGPCTCGGVPFYARWAMEWKRLFYRMTGRSVYGLSCECSACRPNG